MNLWSKKPACEEHNDLLFYEAIHAVQLHAYPANQNNQRAEPGPVYSDAETPLTPH